MIRLYAMSRGRFHLKGSWSKDADWPVNAASVQIVYICGLPLPVLSKEVCFFQFGLLGSQPFWFTLYQCRAKKRLAHDNVIPCHIFQPCSWHHWHRLLCTKWQHAWSWCHDCQTQIVNRMWSPVKTAMCLLFIPFSVVRLVHFRSPLM